MNGTIRVLDVGRTDFRSFEHGGSRHRVEKTKITQVEKAKIWAARSS